MCKYKNLALYCELYLEIGFIEEIKNMKLVKNISNGQVIRIINEKEMLVVKYFLRYK